MLEATNTKTKIGATALSALTNRLPNIENDLATSGAITASKLPKMIAIMICETKPVAFIFDRNEVLSSGVFVAAIVALT